MRISSNWLLSAVVIVCCALSSQGQDLSLSINGPTLGFINDPGGAVVKPILGVPGASLIGPALDLGADVRKTVVSPRQDFAIAVRGENSEAVRIRLASDSVAIESLAGVHAGAESMAISPRGNAVVLYGSEGKFLQSVIRWTEAPEVVFESDVSDIAGTLHSLAIADDGTLALLNFVDDDNHTALWVVSSSGSRWLLAAAHPSAETFLAGRHDVIVADDETQTVDLVIDVDQTSSRIPLASFGAGFEAISGVAATDDGSHVFITSSKSERVTIIDVVTGSALELLCNCRATGVHRLKGAAVFRLSEPSDGPVVLVDLSGSEPRLLIVPEPQAVTTSEVEGADVQ